jgi:hypothetical protein
MTDQSAEMRAGVSGAGQPYVHGPQHQSPTAIDAVLILLRHWKWLVLVPLLAGIASYVFMSTTVPKRYISSTTFLMLNEAAARSAESFILSPAVLDVAIQAHPDLPGETMSQKRRILAGRIRWFVTPGDSRKTANIFYMTVEDNLPSRAQSVAKALIEQWLVLTKPRPDAKIRLEAELERVEMRIQEADLLLQRLSGETKSVVAPNTLQGEFATPIEKLRENRFLLFQQGQKLRVDLAGGSRDAILTQPDLSIEPTYTKTGPVGMSMLAALGLTILTILVHHWFKSAMSLHSASRHDSGS